MRQLQQSAATVELMRVVLDTNILISALIQPAGRSAGLIDSWDDGQFDLLYCDDLLSEFQRVSRSDKLSPFITKSIAGRLVNEIRTFGVFVGPIPTLDVSPDPWDNFLLGTVQAGQADALVTGDKAGLLVLHKFGSAKILSVSAFAEMLGR